MHMGYNVQIGQVSGLYKVSRQAIDLGYDSGLYSSIGWAMDLGSSVQMTQCAEITFLWVSVSEKY